MKTSLTDDELAAIEAAMTELENAAAGGSMAGIADQALSAIRKAKEMSIKRHVYRLVRRMSDGSMVTMGEFDTRKQATDWVNRRFAYGGDFEIWRTRS